MKKALLFLVASLCCTTLATAQHSSEGKRTPPAAASVASSNTGGDSRVRSALVAINQKFMIDADGDFKLVRDTSDGRTQVAWVLSKTNSYGTIEVREIISPAFKTGGSVSTALAIRLLKENDKYKIGAWRLVGEGQNQAVFYAIQISADVDAQSLNAAIKTATLVADALEKEMVGTDDF